MSNPYRIPPSSYQDETSNVATNLPGFFRRSSYASVASGPNTYRQPSAALQHLLNTSNAENSENDGATGIRNGVTGSGTRGGTFGTESDSCWGGVSVDSALPQFSGLQSTPLPFCSRDFEPFMRGPLYGGFEQAPSNNSFFTPSYLRQSVHVQRLEGLHKAKMLEMQQNQQLRAQQGPAASPAEAAAAAASAAGAAAGIICGPGLDTLASSVGSHGLQDGGGLGGLGSIGALGGIGGFSGIADGSAGSKARSGAQRGISDAAEGVSGSRLDEDEAIAPLPSRWSKSDKPTALGVLSDGLEVKFVGSKSSVERDHEASSIRADHYMPPQCGIYYFEITVMTKKIEESTIGIGFSTSSAPLSRPPGWENGSWGYHSDDGHIFPENNNSTGKQYGPTFTSGDVVGCGLNFRTGEAFFTKNGDYLGIAFRDIKEPGLKLYPTVGLKKPGEHIRVNFGQLPFAFDIDGLMKAEQDKINKSIAATSTSNLAPPLGETDLIQQLVLQFLQHDGYVETARAFAKETQTEKEALNLDPNFVVEGVNIADDVEANNRQRIRQAVLAGEIDNALQLTDAHYPNVLKNNEEVLFRLKCRKFIEMIRKEAELNIVGGGSSHAVGTSDDARRPSGPGSQRSQQIQQHMDLDDIDMVEDDVDEHRESEALVTAALGYGQALQAEYRDNNRPEFRHALNEIFSLLAYTNPLKQTEVAHLLDQSGRVAVAEELNSAILRSLGRSSRSALENMYAQTSALLDDLRQDGGPGSFITVQSVTDEIPEPYTM